MTSRGWILFAAMCVIWGIPYLLIKVAVEDVSPSMLVLARTSIAALLLLPIAALRDEVRPVLRRWRVVVLAKREEPHGDGNHRDSDERGHQLARHGRTVRWEIETEKMRQRRDTRATCIFPPLRHRCRAFADVVPASRE